jgi:ribosomal protein S18 acetylase RimI-like enzyme
MDPISYSGQRDQARMLTLAHASAANNMHVADWPYRFASWAFDQPDNVALWTDDVGELVAWAVLQTPFWAVDYVMRLDAESSAVHRAILAWADGRAQSSLGSRFGRPTWFINVMAHQEERVRDLEAMGFTNQADAGENAWSKVLMLREASIPPLEGGSGEAVAQPTPLLSDGFIIRPLKGTHEVEAYVTLHRAVFESESMTAEWRTRTLAQPAYKPGLDFVLAASDGSLCGFCVCWLDGVRGQIEPMGIRVDMRGQRLGQVLLTEGLRRLVAQGAKQVFVETDNYRDAAFALYESVGFHTRHQVYVFRKDYA